VCLETDPEKRKNALLTMRFLERAVCTPEGHSSDSFNDESTKMLRTLSSRDTISLTKTQLPVEDIPGVRLTRDNFFLGTARMQKNNP
jgi:hypothetical protein